MGRPKGSKNKAKETTPTTEPGNPMFNLKDARPVTTDWQSAPPIAAAAITDEDLALERELEKLNLNTEPQISDPDTMPALKKLSEPYTMLSEAVESYKPAKTLQELDDQVMQAKHYECDSIEATVNVVNYFTKGRDPNNTGYFMYKDIRVYIAGFFEHSKKRDLETVEQRNFGMSQVK
jgi:hypothetical protein